jgi:hypothetical protein
MRNRDDRYRRERSRDRDRGQQYGHDDGVSEEPKGRTLNLGAVDVKRAWLASREP